VPLVQQLAVDTLQSVEPELGRAPEQDAFPRDILDGRKDLLPLRLGVASLEHMVG
jgi:hypothetical protein